MIPADLPALHQATGDPRVKENPSPGVSRSWILNGSHFVKTIPAGQSPHAEPAVARAFEQIGLPTTGTRMVMHRAQPYLVSNLLHGHKNLNRLTPEETSRISHDQILKTLLGEWLMNVRDRHGGNYMIGPSGVISIDHGESLSAFHPKDHGETYVSAWASEPHRMVEFPDESTLYDYAREYAKLSPGAVVDPRFVSHVQASDLTPHVAASLHGLPEGAKPLILAGHRARQETLREHAGPLRLADLEDLTEKAREKYLKSLRAS